MEVHYEITGIAFNLFVSCTVFTLLVPSALKYYIDAFIVHSNVNIVYKMVR